MESLWHFELSKLPVVPLRSLLVRVMNHLHIQLQILISTIGAGVIGDITTSAERGSLIGIFGGGKLASMPSFYLCLANLTTTVRMLGQGVGPVFGGLLSQYLGFRAIFWFLTILSGLSLFSILFFLPETLRSVAGNGTVPLHGLSKPFIYHFTGQKDAKPDSFPSTEKKKVTIKTVFEPLGFLGEKDVFITLFFGAIVYTVWSMVTSSTSDLFESTYGLNTLEVGLTFLGNGEYWRPKVYMISFLLTLLLGFGCISGSYTTGYLMDYNHKRTEREYCQKHNLPIDTRITTKTHPDFPIEYARMRNTWWITALFIVCTAVYGVSLRTHLALPIILQYIIAYCATAIFTINSALVIDLYPGASASATAVNNLMRCLIGAAGVAAVQPIIDAITAQYAFILLAGITICMVPLLAIEMRWGVGWRLERSERLKRKEQVV